MIKHKHRAGFGPDTDRLAGQPDEESRRLWQDEMNGLPRDKRPEADLRQAQKRVFEISLLVTLFLLMTAFQLGRSFSVESEALQQVDVKIEVADIPPTEQINRPPPPPKPSVPIPSEDESIPDDLTIESTEIDLTDIPPPPGPPEEENGNFFVAYDEPPQIVGGMAALLSHLEYPPLARKTGVEATVIAKVLVNKSGETQKVEILKVTNPGFDFDTSAMAALLQVKWKPAKQRDRAVTTWVSVPVKFKLTN